MVVYTGPAHPRLFELEFAHQDVDLFVFKHRRFRSDCTGIQTFGVIGTVASETDTSPTDWYGRSKDEPDDARAELRGEEGAHFRAGEEATA